MIATTIRERTIRERFVSVRLFQLCVLIINLCLICAASTAYIAFNYGQKLLLAQNAELLHTVSVVQKEYNALQAAKPLDPQTACPVWFTGANDLKTARDRLCSAKGK